jgi:hypothetical protein
MAHAFIRNHPSADPGTILPGSRKLPDVSVMAPVALRPERPDVSVIAPVPCVLR